MEKKSHHSTSRVSVIIPTHNRAWFLRDAVESVLAQTYRDYQLVVVDDGSTDDTQNLLMHYSDRLRVIRQANKGVSAARNAGIAAAHSDLIALLDSDDTWLPAKLERQVAFFDAHPDALICQTEEIWIRNGRRVNPARKHQKPSGMFFEKSLEMCMVSPSAVMMRRRLIEMVGLFDETMPACEDYDMWLRVGCRFPIHLLDEPLVVKRGGHEDQLSKGWGLDRFRIQSIRNCLDAGILTRAQQDAAVRTLHRKCGIYAEGCRKRGRHDEADRYEALARFHRIR